MLRSLRQYHSERGGPGDSRHPGPISWPGDDDVPVIGDVGMIRAKELEQGSVLRVEARSYLFHLQFVEHQLYFDDVMTRIANGWYVETHRIDRWDEQRQSPIVWLEWRQIYREYHGASHVMGQEYGYG